ncbi:tetratricopeptide repeat protein [Nocardia sp. BMG111209]|uniref:tetratricopeptide repeat protein n=1 Tax=Nocardia sp. BMG111209 TaxID=1160137 RepID=UPI000368A180|nr:tetratricopeptide repeat protein [Nocardia sp. BMG111209]
MALHGLGGVGKTSAATTYAQRHQSEYDLIWQFAAEQAATLSAGMTELSTLLGVRDHLDTADPVARVHSALATRPGPWLLILDNVTDAATVLPALPTVGNGHLLITSRSAQWPPEVGLEVEMLDRAAAVDYLLQRSGDADPGAADAIAAEFGTLPLALEQAAAYVRATAIGLARYLTLLRERRRQILNRGRAWGYDRTVWTTWNIAFDRLATEQPAAIALLRLLACYAPAPVPIRLLLETGLATAQPDEPDRALAAPLQDELGLDDATAALREYSLIATPTSGTLTVHRLVRSVVLEQLDDPARAAWRRIAAAALTESLPGTPDQRASWPIYAALLPHARLLLDQESDGLLQFTTYLEAAGDYATALILLKEVAAARRTALGPDHPGTLQALDDLAFAIGRSGDPEEARRRMEAVLAERIRVQGRDHPDTLVTWDRLVFWTGKAGAAAAACELSAQLVAIREQISGPEHPDTLWARSNLAFQIGDAGDPPGARDHYEPLVPIAIRVFGPDSHGALVIRRNHIHFVGIAGDPARARDLLTTLVPDRTALSGPEHPETLLDRVGLAFWTGVAGDPATAATALESLLPIRERVHGADSADVHKDRARLTWFRSAPAPGTQPPSELY